MKTQDILKEFDFRNILCMGGYDIDYEASTIKLHTAITTIRERDRDTLVKMVEGRREAESCDPAADCPYCGRGLQRKCPSVAYAHEVNTFLTDLLARIREVYE